MTDRNPWTLERVESEMPELAPLARLHRAIEEALLRHEKDRGALHPQHPGAPAVHWLEGRPLLDACDPAPIAAALPGLVSSAANAAASVAPSSAAALSAVTREVLRPGFPWDDALREFRNRDALPAAPEPELFHFLLLRAVSIPARHLGRSVSAPHPDRWKRSSCPFCGVAAAAAVARAGSGRTYLCVLCGGRWETTETNCPSCAETNIERFRVLAAREAGPATLESCGTCGATVKVFSAPDLVWGPPLAAEVLTVRLDLVAERDHGMRRDRTALAAIHPPG